MATTRAGQFLAERVRTSICGFLTEDPARSFDLVWVPGHHRIPGNVRSDRLAKDATYLPRHPSLPAMSLTHLRRRYSAVLVDRWRLRWAMEFPRRSHYFSVHTEPPSLRLLPHIRELPRRLLALVIQVRLGHCFCGDYSRRHRSDDDIECPCVFFLQTRDHILQDCPLYHAHRHYLEAASPTLSLSVLLGTPKGIRAVARFLAASGAFTITGNERDERVPPDRIRSPEARSRNTRRTVVRQAWYTAIMDDLARRNVLGAAGIDGMRAREYFMEHAPASEEAAGADWILDLLEEMERERVFPEHDVHGSLSRRQYLAEARAQH